jgi:hypothetical protein
VPQAVAHGLIFPRIGCDKSSPGFLASILLYVPVGIAYIRSLSETARPVTAATGQGVAAYQWVPFHNGQSCATPGGVATLGFPNMAAVRTRPT